MSHNILITGASGYLGGTLLSNLKTAKLPYNKLYALVRTEQQAKSVKELYNAEPIQINLNDKASIVEAILNHQITVIYYLIDALHSQVQKIMIQGLGELKKQTGKDVHFLHTSGAKLFSSHTGHPTVRPLLDTDRNLHKIQKESYGPVPILRTAVETNLEVIDNAEANGVRSYIFVPSVVYGRGEGFGNMISIQTTAIVRAAKYVRRVYSVDDGYAAWPVCHISDNTALYIELLRNILLQQNPGYGKNGYYLAASGPVTWHDLYSAMAKALAKRNMVDSDIVSRADDAALEKMGKALNCPKEFVPVEIGGHCMFTPERGQQIGWKPRYPAQHILDAADEEVEYILNQL
ncbi:hypothetical protein EYZ11_005655 [Aspergillus tanneri]|uniref:NAD-dependent epimerase/dehydratase domain-containing protein n=1 Tax=Aspergillus tanneri TaxID=1220188 RepID=A0A4V3UPE4_9EURO|nr:uncharacterized protein ATNIH1004_003859 [Aspergillus tanneri]KAA8647976.1 hypothetical protein ATNIH1004_003859 [Aspergillus tanneri]THC94854.1 hypothetical protein EYZ11_005655 [Aspergillus tanneri]